MAHDAANDGENRMNDNETSVSFFVTSPTTVVGKGVKRQSDAAFEEEADGARRVKRRMSTRLAPTSGDDGGAVAKASGNEGVKRIVVPKPRAVAPLGQSRVGNIPAPRTTKTKTKTIPAPRGSGVSVVDAVAVKSKTRSGLKFIPPPLGLTIGGAVDENDAA